MQKFEARNVRKHFEGVVALRDAFLVVEQSKIRFTGVVLL